MKQLTPLIRLDREFNGFLAALDEQLRTPRPLPLIVNGLSRGADTAFLVEGVTEACERSHAPVLILVPDERRMYAASHALKESALRVRTYPERDLVLHSVSASHDTERERLSVLSELMSGHCDVVVTTPTAAALYTVPKDTLRAHAISLRVGDIADIDELCERLSALGFVRTDTVESVGQFARRGGILDLYDREDEPPVRIEFFGDEIDRMSCFDPIDQRMTDACPERHLLPASEVLVDKAARARIAREVGRLLANAPSAQAEARLSSEKTALEQGLSLPFADKYLSLIYPEEPTLFSYLDSTRSVVFIEGTNECLDALRRTLSRYKDSCAALIEEGTLSASSHAPLADEKQYKNALQSHVSVHINPFSGGVGTQREGGLFGFRSRRAVAYGDNPSLLFEDLITFRKSGYRTILVCENESGADSLSETLRSQEISTVPTYKNSKFDYTSLQIGGIYITVGSIDEGFELLMPKIAVLSMSKDSGKAVMAERRQRRVLRRVGGAGERLMSYADLSVGDYVVHRNYGIGRFEGIETVRVDGHARDYITLQYAGTDKLFVPCDRLEMIGKYIGARDSDGTVKLSRMGGADWGRAKARAKRAVADIARDLIQLYARRARTPGFAFPADGEMEREFEDSFEFELTAAQAQAIEEIKGDMMRPVPMNRLLCGDVGFGKTEVALRAVFKAILAGKQAAILVPTTILARSHYQTALSRMRRYPVTVEMLSRFRTPKEQAAILRRTKRGEIDLLIGTHKLLSKNLEFRDLGLLIVDEEQRFGVAQKEKLKTLSTGVDVLTLTATPIPRTLNMAMSGINDISILDEAPSDRRPVQTYVLEHDDAVLYDAIRRELSRRGQVLYLYNKTEDIDLVAGRLTNDFPEARIAYAHGQMEHDTLEDIWQLLVRGELDILVCTTIIETGVDLPNANTLIIEGADRMGLSQLHQLRGRVGRSERQAYAYFTYRKGKALSEVARKRLQVIREYAEFGAGFKIALRDLEIRGAGNLLGAEQHGYIESVGYDLYVRLLNEAVLEEKGEGRPEAFDCTVDIKIDALLPASYIPSEPARMDMYKKISLIGSEEDMQDVLDELCDRFGDPPRVAERLLRIAYMRSRGAAYRLRRIECSGGYLRFLPDKADLAVWSELFLRFPGLSLRGVGTPAVLYRLKTDEDATDTAFAILKAYTEVSNKEAPSA